MLVLPFSVESFGLSQPAVDEVDGFSGCRDATLRFLLERVQHVNRVTKLDRVDETVCASIVGNHDLENGTTAESFQGL
jgi:hypothetical protein